VNANGRIDVGSGEILQESHYYPLGLEFKGHYWQSSGYDYRYKFNGIERINDLSLGIDLAFFRGHDPVTGRWLQVDPLADLAPNLNGYRFAFNNPLRFTDRSGLFEKQSDAENYLRNYIRLNGNDGGWGITRAANGMYGITNGSLTVMDMGDGLGPQVWLPEVIINGFRNQATLQPARGYYPAMSGTSADQEGGGDWLRPEDNINNGIGGFGEGMKQFGGTFRLNNSSGFSPKFYKISKVTGRGWGGGGRGLIKTFSTSPWGKGIGYGSLGVSFVLGGVNVYSAIQKDGGTYGDNTQMAVAQTSLGITGAWAGAEIGAAFGVWFGGIGAIPGAVIGGVIGGVAGGLGGSKLGEGVYNITH
jgi:RHS repeat-associated protein